MSRSGYVDDSENWDLIRWRGAVNSAIIGRRGQSFLKELLAALDAMPEKKLIANTLESNGEYCALGVVGKARGVDLKSLDPEDSETVADTFNIARALAKEIVYMNDEGLWYGATPEKRWQYVREWVAKQVKG